MNYSIRFFIAKIRRLLFCDVETNSTFRVWRWHIDHAVYSIVYTFLAGILLREVGVTNYFYCGFALVILIFVLVKIHRRFWIDKKTFYDAFTDLNQYLAGITVPLLIGGLFTWTLIVLVVLFAIYFLTIKFTNP